MGWGEFLLVGCCFSRELCPDWLCKSFFLFLMWANVSVSGASGRLVLSEFNTRETFIERCGLMLMFAPKQCGLRMFTWFCHPGCNHVTMQTPVFPEIFFTILWDLHGSVMKQDETAHVSCFHVQFWLGLVGQQWPRGHWQLSAPDKSSGEGHDNHDKCNNKRKSRLKQPT